MATISKVFTLLTSTGAYTAGDAVGSLLTLDNIVTKNGGGGRIESVTLYDSAAQAIAATLWFFDAPITPTADNAAFAPVDIDMRKCVGTVPITSYATTAPTNNQVGTARAVGLCFACQGNSQTLYAQLQTNGAPTYDTSGVKLIIALIQD